jgi:membrane protein YqaA with SNARE-associated domain
LKGLVFWAQSTVAALGGLGLLVVAFVDSAILTLPEAVDLLVVWLVVRNEAAAAYYVGLATVGSVAGCMVLYWLTRKGGEAFLRKRVAAERLERGVALFNRWGMLTVIVASILPPPTPFKLFILLAGVGGVTPARFAIAVTIGRVVRFGTVALLALWIGDEAIAYIREHAITVGLAMLASLLAGALVYLMWRRWGGWRTGRV